MKKASIIILIIGLCLLLAGGAIFTATMSRNNWDFGIFSNVDFEEQTYTANADEVTSIVVDTSTLGIKYVPADDNNVTIDYYTVTTKKGKVIGSFQPALTGGVLTFEEVTEKYPFWGILTPSHYIVVKVPASKGFTVKFKASTENIYIGETGQEIKVPDLTLEASTGNVKIEGKVVCTGNLTIKTSTGNITCSGDISAQNVTMEASTGNVSFKAPLTAKTVSIKTSTGNVKSENPLAADRIDVECSTGNVHLLLKGKQADYSYSYDISTGKSNLSAFAGGAKTIRIKTSTGNATITFSE